MLHVDGHIWYITNSYLHFQPCMNNCQHMISYLVEVNHTVNTKGFDSFPVAVRYFVYMAIDTHIDVFSKSSSKKPKC